jgi:hypothetical protein
MRYLAGQPIAGCPQIQAHVCATDRVADRATDGSKGVLSKAKRCEERPEQRAIPKLGMVHDGGRVRRHSWHGWLLCATSGSPAETLQTG